MIDQIGGGRLIGNPVHGGVVGGGPQVGIHRMKSSRARRLAGSGGVGGNGGVGGGGGGGGGDAQGGSDNNPFPWLMAAGCAAHSIVHPPKILADEITTTVDQTWETIGPFVTKMGFSGLIGLAAAGVLKVVGKTVAFTLGFLFIAIQVLVSSEIVEVDWKKVQQKLGVKLDVTGDKKFDEKDVKTYMDRLLRVLTEGVPSVGGFLGGFILGVKIL